MLNPQTDNVTQAMQEAAQVGAEQAGRIVQISAEAGERAARAGTEILQRNAETVQEALHSSAEIAARLTERSADHFGRAFGISGEEAHKAVRKSSDNIDAIIHSSSILAEVTQSISREWVSFTRERMEHNFDQFDRLLRCRSPQELTALQSEFLRDNLESFLQCARRIAQKAMQTSDETTQPAEAVERVHAA